MKSSNAEKKLIKELKTEGHHYKGIDDIFASKKYLEPVEVSLILTYLPKILDEELGAGVHLVYCLNGARQVFDPTPLVKLFEESNFNPTVKSCIGIVIVTAKTGDISQWLKARLLGRHVGFENFGLVSGLLKRGGFKNNDDLKDFLEQIFDKYPIPVLQLYDKIGSKEDIDFLLERIDKSDIKINKEIAKTLKKILKREGIQKPKE